MNISKPTLSILTMQPLLTSDKKVKTPTKKDSNFVSFPDPEMIFREPVTVDTKKIDKGTVSTAKAKIEFKGLSLHHVAAALRQFDKYPKMFHPNIIFAEVTEDKGETVKVTLQAQKLGIKTGKYVLEHTIIPDHGGMSWHEMGPVKNLAHCSGSILLSQSPDHQGVILDYSIEISTGFTFFEQMADAVGRSWVVAGDAEAVIRGYFEAAVRQQR